MASDNGSTVLLNETESITNFRSLIVVTVRGSVTLNDWINDVITQLYPLDNRFVALKDEIADNLESHLSIMMNGQQKQNLKAKVLLLKNIIIMAV